VGGCGRALGIRGHLSRCDPSRIADAIAQVGDTGATILSTARAVAFSIALSMPSVTKVKGASSRGQPSGTLWVTTTTGPPIGWFPPQPLVESNSRRPTTSAPVMPMMVRKCSALTADIRKVSGWVVGTTTSPLPYHLKRCSKPVSAGPEM
jgi:hypothetical protein